MYGQMVITEGYKERLFADGGVKALSRDTEAEQSVVR